MKTKIIDYLQHEKVKYQCLGCGLNQLDKLTTAHTNILVSYSVVCLPQTGGNNSPANWQR